MRILMTADCMGGVWTYAIELTRALAAHNVHVVIATMGHPLSSAQQAQVKTLRNLDVRQSGYKLEWMAQPWQDVAEAGRWLMELAENFGVDLVHLNGYVHAAMEWDLPVLVVGHSCVLSWFQAARKTKAPASWDRYRDEVTRGIQAADLVVAPTQAMMDQLQYFYGPLGRSTIIPNGRRAGSFEPLMKEPFIFSAGRLWDEGKNVLALEKIADQLSWPVFVAGEWRHPGGDDPGHEPALSCLGTLGPAALANWMGRAGIFCLPARYEPFGLSALEAALSGCALVLGDIPALREVWQDAAIFVEPEDHQALQVRLTELCNSHELRTVMARKAQARAMTFSAELMAQRYMDCYRQLLEPASRPVMRMRRDLDNLRISSNLGGLQA